MVVISHGLALYFLARRFHSQLSKLVWRTWYCLSVVCTRNTSSSNWCWAMGDPIYFQHSLTDMMLRRCEINLELRYSGVIPSEDLYTCHNWHTSKYKLHDFGASEACQRNHCHSCPRQQFSIKMWLNYMYTIIYTCTFKGIIKMSYSLECTQCTQKCHMTFSVHILADLHTKRFRTWHLLHWMVIYTERRNFRRCWYM